MKVAKLAEDLTISLIEDGKICLIEIDNPSWNWMAKYLGGKRTVQIERKILKRANEKFFRDLIDKTYKENKHLILEAKRKNFRAY